MRKIKLQHIIQFAFDFEDDKIRKSIEQNIENQVVKNIQEQIKKGYFEKRWGENPVDNLVDTQVKNVVEKHKDEIIERTAHLLCERLLRRKSVKEQILGIVEKNKEEN